MGVEKEHIAFYGIKVDGELFFDSYNEDDIKNIENEGGILVNDVVDYSKCRKPYDPKECNFILLNDYYSGEYSCIGICISAYGRDRFDEDRDLDVNLSLESIIKLDKELREECQKRGIDISNYEPKLYIITQYT